jgi:thiol-disulfide isomerase/thioredoxin
VRFVRAVVAASALVLAVSACGSGTSATGGAAAGSSGATTGGPSSTAWLELPLVDARTGETFTLADFSGQPLYVENFATWCTNCRKQLGNVQEAAAGASGVAFVSLSVETDLDPGDVASYAERQGFDDIRFAVMSSQMLAAMNDAFGTSALNPPSTPHLYVTADGEVGQLETGFESASDIQAKLGAAGSG